MVAVVGYRWGMLKCSPISGPGYLRYAGAHFRRTHPHITLPKVQRLQPTKANPPRIDRRPSHCPEVDCCPECKSHRV